MADSSVVDYLGDMKQDRSAIILIRNGSVALIRRVNERGTYYLFPGGGVEEGETLEEAAIREAKEELGLDVELGPLLCRVQFGENAQFYFSARAVGGDFGTGAGEELSLTADSESSSYEPVWLACSTLGQYDVYPIGLARLLRTGGLTGAKKPFSFVETNP